MTGLIYKLLPFLILKIYTQEGLRAFPSLSQSLLGCPSLSNEMYLGLISPCIILFSYKYDIALSKSLIKHKRKSEEKRF